MSKIYETLKAQTRVIPTSALVDTYRLLAGDSLDLGVAHDVLFLVVSNELEDRGVIAFDYELGDYVFC